MKKWTALLLTLALLLSLAACGGSSKSSSAVYSNSAQAPAAAPMEMEMAGGTANNYAALTEESGTMAEGQQARKWIVTLYLTAETEDLDAMLEELDQTITDLNGYVENHSIYNGSSYNSSRRRSASLTIRVPVEQADAFTGHVGAFSNLVRQEQEKEDITLTYVATESRMQALETEQTRLLELLAQAENMSDLLEIEARLTDVRYELESVTSQLRLYDNQVDYATVYLDISEVVEYTPVEEPTIWERITGGFMDSVQGVSEGAVDAVVWVIANSPYLLVWAVILFAAWKLKKKLNLGLRRKTKVPKAPRQEKPEQ